MGVLGRPGHQQSAAREGTARTQELDGDAGEALDRSAADWPTLRQMIQQLGGVLASALLGTVLATLRDGAVGVDEIQHAYNVVFWIATASAVAIVALALRVAPHERPSHTTGSPSVAPTDATASIAGGPTPPDTVPSR